MIDKLEFYHGAAIIRLVDDPRCITLSKHAQGYRVNQNLFVFIKYAARAHSPWRFTFSQEDIKRLERAKNDFAHCVIALVCGGDGICALDYDTLIPLLQNSPGWIASKRGFAGCYTVSGSAGKLKRKIAMNQWPEIVFNREMGNDWHDRAIEQCEQTA